MIQAGKGLGPNAAKTGEFAHQRRVKNEEKDPMFPEIVSNRSSITLNGTGRSKLQGEVARIPYGKGNQATAQKDGMTRGQSMRMRNTADQHSQSTFPKGNNLGFKKI
jgi:hypothetical protein